MAKSSPRPAFNAPISAAPESSTRPDATDKAARLQAFLKNRRDAQADAANHGDAVEIVDISDAEFVAAMGADANLFDGLPDFEDAKTPPMQRPQSNAVRAGSRTANTATRAQYSETEKLLRQIHALVLIVMAMLAFLILFEIGRAVYQSIRVVPSETTQMDAGVAEIDGENG